MTSFPDTVALPASDDTDADVAAATVEALARALELHDYRRGSFGETAAHGLRVTELALDLTRLVAPQLLRDPHLADGFRLHDIGMIGVASVTLLKTGSLAPDEVAEIQEHPWLGERIVAPVAWLNGTARQVIGCHHERWDGSGYPRGLRGDEIPLVARIFSIVDAYETMTNPQQYRDALPLAFALDELEAKAGTQFDPAIAAAFVESIRSGDTP